MSPFFHRNSADYASSPNDFPVVTTQDRTSTYGGGQVSFNANTAKNNLQAGVYSFYQQDNELFGVIFNDGSGNPTVLITNPGSGYTAGETISFSAGGGSDLLARLVAQKGLDLLYDIRTNGATLQSAQDYLKAQKPPTLVVSGKNDILFTGENQERYREVLPDAEIHLTDSGHCALADKTEEISSRVRDFLGRVV